DLVAVQGRPGRGRGSGPALRSHASASHPSPPGRSGARGRFAVRLEPRAHRVPRPQLTGGRRPVYLRDVRAGRAPRGAFLLVLSFVLQSTGCERDPEPRSEPEAPERPRLEAAPQVLDWSREADAQGVPIEEATPVPDAPPVPQFVARGG